MAGDKYLALGASGFATQQAAVDSSAGAGDAGKIVALDSGGKLASSMFPNGFGEDASTAVAFENLAAGDFVNLFNDTGTLKARKADASGGLAKMADGYVEAAYTTGQTATITKDGFNSQVSGLTIGTRYFLSESTPGGIEAFGTLAATAGHIVQYLGVARSATELAVDIDESPIVRA